LCKILKTINLPSYLLELSEKSYLNHAYHQLFGANWKHFFQDYSFLLEFLNAH